jgi:ubiquinone/menaquinone biosynthesis C-methylase UbiE
MPQGVLEPRELMRGGCTAEAGVVEYRLGRVRALTPVAGRWLDCGCAEGSWAAALLDAGADAVLAADIESDRIAEAQRRWANISNLDFVVASAEDLPVEDAALDGVLLNEVLEHVGDQDATLAELHRVLKPGGVLIVFSPNRWFPFEGHGAVFGRLRFMHPVPLMPWLPQRLTWRTMTARNYWPGQLADIVRRGGFAVEAVDFALPLFTKYRWMPGPMLRWYARAMPRLDQVRAFRRFGVSTLVVARKPAAGGRTTRGEDLSALRRRNEQNVPVPGAIQRADAG